MNDDTLSIDDCVISSRSPLLMTRSMVMATERNNLFVVEDASHIVKSVIERVIRGSPYEPNRVNRWTADIIDQTLTDLGNLNKPFKYIVYAVLTQKNGTGLHTASSCLWDNATDGSCTVRWENKYIYAIVTVFGLSL